MVPSRPSRGWIGLRPSSGVVAILLTLLAFALFWSVAGRPLWVARHLMLVPSRALGPEPWQLITYALWHTSLMALLSSAIGLWFFGTPVEQRLGRGALFRVVGAAALAGGLAQAALGRLVAPQAVVAGAGPVALGCIAAFGVALRRAPLLFFGVARVQAETLAVIFVAVSAVMHLMASDFVGLAGALGGAGAGALAARAPSGSGVRRRWERFKKWRIRRRYRVIPGGRSHSAN